MGNLITLDDFTKGEILDLITLAKDIKSNPRKYAKAMDGRVLAMIFEKPSLRTRVSFEAGMSKMGGSVIFLSKGDIQLGRGETVEDTARVTSRYVDIMMARVFEYSTIEELAENATVPVINGLTNINHPCQILGDLLTVSEKLGKVEGIKVAFLGDCSNNTCNSWATVAPKLGIELCCGFPEGYGPSESVLKKSKRYKLTQDPKAAVRGADMVYTDTWMSMHIVEDERAKRLADLDDYRVTKDLMKLAKPKAIFMHCLPAHRGEEMTAEVIDGPQSVVLDQAENRMWMQDAIMLKLLKLA